MSAQTLLSGGDKWYAYSGVVFGDVSVPATIKLISVPNSGLRDTFLRIMPFYGLPASVATGSGLGISVKLNDVEILNDQANRHDYVSDHGSYDMFIPRQSKIEIISLNTSANNTQTRGANAIGYYL